MTQTQLKVLAGPNQSATRSSALGLASQADAYNGEFGHNSESGIDDQTLAMNVAAALANMAGIGRGAIDAESFGEVVQLSGTLQSQADIDTAVAVASRLEGVYTVRNCLKLEK